MRIVVLGASGGVGRQLVEQAAGPHDVVAVVRATSDYAAPAGVELVRAEVMQAGALDAVLHGADAVVSGLGMRRKNLFPWSAPTSPTDLNSTSARHLVAAMRNAGVRKVVAVSAAGVGDSASGMNAVMRGLVGSSTIGIAYRDLAVMEQVFADAELDWCCPRPVTLTRGSKTERVREVDHFGSFMSISRADVAWWMLRRLEHGGPPTPQIASA